MDLMERVGGGWGIVVEHAGIKDDGKAEGVAAERAEDVETVARSRGGETGRK